MSNTGNQLSQTIPPRRELGSYAVRAIGPFGQDVLCTTVQAFGPADAIHSVMEANRSYAADAARCWVVTRL